MNQFEIQDSQYTFPYHYLMYGNYPKMNFNECLWYKTATDAIVAKVKEINPNDLLDVGCGDACLLNILNKETNIELCGADMSDRAIQLAQTINPQVDFVCGDFINIEKEYECITCIEVMEHIGDTLLPAFIKGLSDRLKKGGRLIVTVPTIARPVHPKHYRHYDLQLLQRDFANYAPELKIEKVRYMNKEDRLINRYSYKRGIIIPLVERVLTKYYIRKCLFGDNEKECLRLLVVLSK